jgi:hypothetical protein
MTGTDQCKENQLATYQGSCCDAPPSDFCFLCANGSTVYQADKVIPASAKNKRNHTCEEAATFDKYLLDTTRPGDCEFASRGLSRAWCDCDGAEPLCQLKCPDGNPPPDLELAEPVFGKTCLRWMYETTTLQILSAGDECPNADSELNFDAVAFCCPTVPAPDNCSICPAGERLKGDADALTVQTEFFGTVTCGELETYASFLPSTTATACSDFYSGLDIRQGEDCCEIDPDATLSPVAAPAGGDGGDGATNHNGPAGSIIWLGLMVLFSTLPIVLA